MLTVWIKLVNHIHLVCSQFLKAHKAARMERSLGLFLPDGLVGVPNRHLLL